MRRRLTALLALVAMVAGLAMPAHAYAHLRAPGGMAADVCTTRPASPAPAAPRAPHATACDACASCMPAGASGASPSQAVAAAGYLHAGLVVAAVARALPDAHFDARAPPPLP